MVTPLSADDGLPSFARLLRRHRTRVGLTQRGLADLSTISVRAIRDLEQGRALRPRQDTVRLIADGLRLGSRARLDLELAADPGRRVALDATAATPPSVLTPQVGRDAETGTLVDELEGGRRLVTLVGLPGVGKTRLAAAVAAAVHPRWPVLWAGPDGTPIRDRRLADVVESWSAAVRAEESPADDLAELVGARPAVLVLDGLPGPLFGRPVLRVLVDCPELRVVLTAPHPCELPGERVFLVSALEPDAAARLFLAHAPAGSRLGEADSAAVTAICRALDGVPAAIAAVAPWLAVYTPEDLAEAVRADPAGLLDSTYLAALGDVAATAGGVLGGLPAAFDLADVSAATGLAPASAGRVLRELLERGLVRPRSAAAGPRFAVPALVRAALPVGV